LDSLAGILEETPLEPDDPSSTEFRTLLEQVLWEIEELQTRSSRIRRMFRPSSEALLKTASL
ncbi:MAG: hypothetical protein KGR26_16555, partial [Cyanobacteria bacterium REEB65]|nr:hypothetical protein [Cyanobacteria bacterium REEB65]